MTTFLDGGQDGRHLLLVVLQTYLGKDNTKRFEFKVRTNVKEQGKGRSKMKIIKKDIQTQTGVWGQRTARERGRQTDKETDKAREQISFNRKKKSRPRAESTKPKSLKIPSRGDSQIFGSGITSLFITTNNETVLVSLSLLNP